MGNLAGEWFKRALIANKAFIDACEEGEDTEELEQLLQVIMDELPTSHLSVSGRGATTRFVHVFPDGSVVVWYDDMSGEFDEGAETFSSLDAARVKYEIE